VISGRIRNLACSLGALFLVSALPVSAGAAEAEPAIGSYAWYWETQQSQAITDPTSGADVATIEAPNPFCPSTTAGGPPEQAGACHPGRLPIEVQGADYETPEKMSAVAFDLALVPIGSTVSKFKVSFLEATDNQSTPSNAEGKSLQACLINEFFGDGEARQYKEVPRHKCTKGDPVAKRKAVQVKTKDGKVERFQYSFDLTAFAKKWVAGAPVAAIMLMPVQPKEADANPGTDTNWRVVLDGPAEEKGVATSLTYKPPPEDALDALDDLDDLDTIDDTGSTDSFDTGSTDSFDSGGSDVGSSDTSDTDLGSTDAAEDPLATDLADGTEPTATTGAGGIPGYMWLALLGGMIGFFLFRSVVLESAAGIRPDGVLSQIRQINASKRGGAIELDETTGLAAKLAPLSGGLKRIGSLKGKIPFLHRKG